MPDIRRFVTYLYYYENNQKRNIAGFAKVEVRGGQCRLEIHLKASGLIDRPIPVYLFAREGKMMQAVEIGQMNPSQMSGDYKSILKGNQIGHSSYSIDDIKGMILTVDESRMYASQWDDEEILRENMRIYEPQLEIPLQSGVQHEKEEAGIPEAISEPAKEPGMETNLKTEAASLHTEELAMSKIITPDFTIKQTLWDCWENIKKKMTVIHPIEGEKIICVHMELRDIRELPKKYWYLGNNSFLLHGFFNYRYLLMGERKNETERELFLGVPGVYLNQEKVMASIFGFPQFITEKEAEQKEEKFGYWCHIIHE